MLSGEVIGASQRSREATKSPPVATQSPPPSTRCPSLVELLPRAHLSRLDSTTRPHDVLLSCVAFLLRQASACLLCEFLGRAQCLLHASQPLHARSPLTFPLPFDATSLPSLMHCFRCRCSSKVHHFQNTCKSAVSH